MDRRPHEPEYPCQEHSGVMSLLGELKEGQEKIWLKMDEALKRWPPGVTIVLSTMSGILCGLVGLILGRYLQ